MFQRCWHVGAQSNSGVIAPALAGVVLRYAAPATQTYAPRLPLRRDGVTAKWENGHSWGRCGRLPPMAATRPHPAVDFVGGLPIAALPVRGLGASEAVLLTQLDRQPDQLTIR
jgi:hypothetical protein